jgi:heptosyltransferase-3
MPRPKNVGYFLNQKIRRLASFLLRSVTTQSIEKRLNLRQEGIAKILLVRATFRMGDSVLATPAIYVFRQKFPNARIDFVGSPISGSLFRNVPIDHSFHISRSFPQASWAYVCLIRQIRSVAYDLAVDLSCSQSAMGSVIVGFSGARLRIGLRGKWDRWFNVRIARPAERNKYRILPAFLRTLGLEPAGDVLPSLNLSSAEKEEGRKRIESLLGHSARPLVGVFVGGRKTWGKRWPSKNFYELITALYRQGVNVVTFFGPDEQNLIGPFRKSLDPGLPLCFEPSAINFAAMVSHCDLFITCDSGPMHLACALGTRTVAIFQYPNFEHWAPPSSLSRIVYQPGGCSVQEVLRSCLVELSNTDHVAIRNPHLDTTGPRPEGFLQREY